MRESAELAGEKIDERERHESPRHHCDEQPPGKAMVPASRRPDVSAKSGAGVAVEPIGQDS